MDIDNNKIIFRISFFVAGIISAIFLPWYISVLLIFSPILIYSSVETIFIAVFLDTIYSQGGFFMGHIFLIISFVLLLMVFEIKKSLIF
ncbi:MAG: hypothetical protein WCV55_01500 [Candidatus Paceibacterota bacterium]